MSVNNNGTSGLPSLPNLNQKAKPSSQKPLAEEHHDEAAEAAAAKVAAYETGWSDLTPNQILAVFLSLSIGQMLVAMDQSMIAVAMPNIVDQLNYPEMQSWLISGYILTNGTLSM